MPEPTLCIQLITANKMAKLLWKHRELDAFQFYLNPASLAPNPDPDPDPEPKPPDPFAPATVLSPERERHLHQLLQEAHRPVFNELQLILCLLYPLHPLPLTAPPFIPCTTHTWNCTSCGCLPLPSSLYHTHLELQRLQLVLRLLQLALKALHL